MYSRVHWLACKSSKFQRSRVQVDRRCMKVYCCLPRLTAIRHASSCCWSRSLRSWKELQCIDKMTNPLKGSPVGACIFLSQPGGILSANVASLHLSSLTVPIQIVSLLYAWTFIKCQKGCQILACHQTEIFWAIQLTCQGNQGGRCTLMYSSLWVTWKCQKMTSPSWIGQRLLSLVVAHHHNACNCFGLIKLDQSLSCGHNFPYSPASWRTSSAIMDSRNQTGKLIKERYSWTIGHGPDLQKQQTIVNGAQQNCVPSVSWNVEVRGLWQTCCSWWHY